MFLRRNNFFIKKVFFVLILIVFSINVICAETPIQRHKLAIGFNLGYLSDVHKFSDSVFLKIIEDGYTVLRVYEPFFKNDEDLSLLKSRLSFLLDKKFKVLLSLSNFPYGSNFSDINKTDYVSAKKIYSYSNRFPPNDSLETKLYFDKLEHILEYFKHYISSGHLYFEIGNEPEAPRFYWGSYNEFISLHRLTIDLLSKHTNRKPLCCGFTTKFIFQNKNSDFSKVFLDSTIINKIQISYHIYTEKARRYSSAYHLYNSSVTEWGVFSQFKENNFVKKAKLENKFIAELILFLDFAYTNNIKEVYLFKMQDLITKKGRLGFFDISGNKKYIYTQLNILSNIIEKGYYIIKDKNILSIVGDSEMVSLNLMTNTFVIKDTKH